VIVRLLHLKAPASTGCKGFAFWAPVPRPFPPLYTHTALDRPPARIRRTWADARADAGAPVRKWLWRALDATPWPALAGSDEKLTGAGELPGPGMRWRARIRHGSAHRHTPGAHACRFT